MDKIEMSKRRREIKDRIAEYIRKKAPIDEKDVVTFFARKTGLSHITIKRYIEELRQEDLFFKSPKGRLVRETWPFDEGDPPQEYGKWQRLHFD